MRNLLFRLLILFEVFDELQLLIYKISEFGTPLNFSAAPWNSGSPPPTQQNLNPPLVLYATMIQDV